MCLLYRQRELENTNTNDGLSTAFCHVLSLALTFQCQVMAEGEAWHHGATGQTAVAWSI